MRRTRAGWPGPLGEAARPSAHAHAVRTRTHLFRWCWEPMPRRAKARRDCSRRGRSSRGYGELGSGRSDRRTAALGCHGPWLTSTEKIDLHAGQVTHAGRRHARAADPERGRRGGPKTVRITLGGQGVAIWHRTERACGRGGDRPRLVTCGFVRARARGSGRVGAHERGPCPRWGITARGVGPHPRWPCPRWGVEVRPGVGPTPPPLGLPFHSHQRSLVGPPGRSTRVRGPITNRCGERI